MDSLVTDYLTNILGKDAKTKSEKNAVGLMRKLLLAKEKITSTEINWNWRDKKLLPERACQNRGRTYNGYPVSPGYFGAYSMDGLAMALYCIYNTNNFDEAV